MQQAPAWSGSLFVSLSRPAGADAWLHLAPCSPCEPSGRPPSRWVGICTVNWALAAADPALPPLCLRRCIKCCMAFVQISSWGHPWCCNAMRFLHARSPTNTCRYWYRCRSTAPRWRRTCGTAPTAGLETVCASRRAGRRSRALASRAWAPAATAAANMLWRRGRVRPAGESCTAGAACTAAAGELGMHGSMTCMGSMAIFVWQHASAARQSSLEAAGQAGRCAVPAGLAVHAERARLGVAAADP